MHVHYVEHVREARGQQERERVVCDRNIQMEKTHLIEIPIIRFNHVNMS